MELVWKALADPTRRAILDALREQPLTTGALCEPFELSRFAVMKHLTVLEAAGLVLTRREGRERWNHLNAVPIQGIYERWVRPYEAHWAQSLLRLRDNIKHEERTMSTKNKSETGYGVAQIEMEIAIAAKPERVWSALIGETSRWWLRDFYSDTSAKGFVIEPTLGGRAYEDWGDGAGFVWYTVIGIQAPRSITMQGLLTPAFGGPSQTILQLALEASGKATTLRLSDTLFGKVSDEKREQTREGWQLLFGSGLKAFVEAG